MSKIDRVADRALKDNGVTVRPINMKDFQGEVRTVWEVYNAAWARNWGFVPMTKEEFLLQGKEMKQILKPELVLIGEDRWHACRFCSGSAGRQSGAQTGGREPASPRLFKILYYQRLVRSVRVLALGVVEEYRATGVAAGFYAALVRNARKLGFTGNAKCPGFWKTMY